MENSAKKSTSSKTDNVFVKLLNYARSHTVALVAVVLLFFVFLLPAAAYGVLIINNALVQAKNNQIEIAISNKDYNTWKNLVNDENLKSKITAENFSSYVDIYNLLKQGNIVEANPSKEALGLKRTFSPSSEKSQDLKTAIQANDYPAWRSMVGAETMVTVTAENFSDYVKAYTAASDGDVSRANGFLRKLNLKSDDFSSGR